MVLRNGPVAALWRPGGGGERVQGGLNVRRWTTGTPACRADTVSSSLVRRADLKITQPGDEPTVSPESTSKT